MNDLKLEKRKLNLIAKTKTIFSVLFQNIRLNICIYEYSDNEKKNFQRLSPIRNHIRQFTHNIRKNKSKLRDFSFSKK